jgi:hypothetical protein
MLVNDYCNPMGIGVGMGVGMGVESPVEALPPYSKII